MYSTRERSHSFVAQREDGGLVVIDVYRADDGKLELETEDGVAIKRTPGEEYESGDGYQLTSNDPERV